MCINNLPGHIHSQETQAEGLEEWDRRREHYLDATM